MSPGHKTPHGGGERAHGRATHSARYSLTSPLGARVFVQSYTVLVVDKAELVRRTTNRTLTKEGYRVLEAADAKEALAVLAMPRARVDLVLIGAVGH